MYRALCVPWPGVLLGLENTTAAEPRLVIGAHAVDTRTEPVADGDPGWTPLIDVSAIPLTDLIAARDTALGRSILRLIESLDDPDGVLSAFSSFVDS
jgi:FXSXX-COOH protein